MVFKNQDLETRVLCASGEDASFKSLMTGCILHTVVSNNSPGWHLTLFLLATLPFNQNQRPAMGTRPGPLCFTVLALLSALSTEPTCPVFPFRGTRAWETICCPVRGFTPGKLAAGGFL